MLEEMDEEFGVGDLIQGSIDQQKQQVLILFEFRTVLTSVAAYTCS